MPQMGNRIEPSPLAILIRTLIVAGFTIEAANRQGHYDAVQCSRTDLFGLPVGYVILRSTRDEWEAREQEQLVHLWQRTGRKAVFVATEPGESWLSADELSDMVGGAVPTWRALTEEFPEALRIASRNQNPEGFSGEAWRLFEELVADGIEFVLGRRVTRLGGRRRGEDVPDIHALASPEFVVVVDAKASREGFEASRDAIRPLADYVRRLRARQRGASPVGAALIVSSEFHQQDSALKEKAAQFLGETQVPLAFLTSEGLVGLIEMARARPQLRVAVRWNLVLTGGPVNLAAVAAEFDAAERERLGRGR